MVKGPLYPILHSFWVSFYFQMQQIQSEKISGKNSIKMIQNGSISPYRVFKGPQRVTHRWGHHLPLIWAQLCQDWSRGPWAKLIDLDLNGSIIQTNEIKMVKRDWKLPNLSYFTYTSIVQPVLQVYNPFLQANSSFSQF